MKVNGANITNPDLVVDNGVCHAIDKLLMPKMKNHQCICNAPCI
jgi:uncharacterized surface protein with fasciclin (FAS1) repeats